MTFQACADPENRHLYIESDLLIIHLKVMARLEQILDNLNSEKSKYSKISLKRPLKRRPKLVCKTDDRLIQVKSIAEFCNTFDLH